MGYLVIHILITKAKGLVILDESINFTELSLSFSFTLPYPNTDAHCKVCELEISVYPHNVSL